MKNLNLKSVLLVAIAFSFSVITYAQHDHQMMKMMLIKRKKIVIKPIKIFKMKIVVEMMLI